ncbi:unnamed protein product, partial [Mesorhabditis belari]|uniref:C2H2-type domain-containing protein n=1 Tax=Mesorhabditis belari TaxID=2138241 RepID=A0AAF3F2Q7_9BILA
MVDESKLTPLNTRVDPTTLRYFMCYLCGDTYYIQSDYQRHIVDHQWASLAEQLYEEEIKNERMTQREKNRQRSVQEEPISRKASAQEIATEKIPSRRQSITKSKSGDTEKKTVKREKLSEMDLSKVKLENQKVGNSAKPMFIKKEPQMIISPVLFQEMVCLEKLLGNANFRIVPRRPQLSDHLSQNTEKKNKSEMAEKQDQLIEPDSGSSGVQEENSVVSATRKRHASTSVKSKLCSVKKEKLIDRELEMTEKSMSPAANQVPRASQSPSVQMPLPTILLDQPSPSSSSFNQIPPTDEVKESFVVADGLLTCKIKAEVASIMTALLEDVSMENSSQKLQCDKCSIDFPNKLSLINHNILSHNMNIDQVKMKYYADDRFIKETPLVDHPSCNKCNIRFSHPSRYYVHMFTMHREHFFTRKDTTRVHFSFVIQGMAVLYEDEFELFRDGALSG